MEGTIVILSPFVASLLRASSAKDLFFERSRSFASLRMTMAVGAMACALAGCFPTFQAARIDPGFRVEAGVIRVGDRREGGGDYIITLNPAYGFGRRLEIGLPVGVYSELGLPIVTGNDSNWPLFVMPYGKLALLAADSKHHLSVTAQTVAIVPASIGLRYGRDLGNWEPQIGITYILSGNDPDAWFVQRYNQPGQRLVAASVGATLNRSRRPALEIGVLRDSYIGCNPACASGQRVSRLTFFDAFLGFSLSVVK